MRIDEPGAALNEKNITANCGEVLLEGFVNAGNRGVHEGDRYDADDDANRRERRAHFVRAQCGKRDPQTFVDFGPEPHTGYAAAVSTERVELRFVSSSLAISPSRMRTIRRACRATSSSCVTTMMVFPFSESVSNRAMISSPVFESRFPVGSSARMMDGSLTRARAMATR